MRQFAVILVLLILAGCSASAVLLSLTVHQAAPLVAEQTFELANRPDPHGQLMAIRESRGRGDVYLWLFLLLAVVFGVLAYFGHMLIRERYLKQVVRHKREARRAGQPLRPAQRPQPGIGYLPTMRPVPQLPDGREGDEGVQWSRSGDDY